MDGLLLPSVSSVKLFAVAWQEPGERMGWEPLSVWRERDWQLEELRGLVESRPRVRLAAIELRLEVPTIDLGSLEHSPETAWDSDAILPEELDAV
ncbi:MAG TPA: hypothetical protein VFJ57_12030 [Solirubrobacterales bacterium]|nr:hypothetical protein [Solirubrobacterales bacterium]